MERNIWSEVRRVCLSCGALFLTRQGSTGQMCCHVKCRRRARGRQPLKFHPPPLRAVALTVNAVLLREALYIAMPVDAIGYQLWSEVLQCWFPAVGKRLTYDGGYSEAPFFTLGGGSQNGVFIPWEAPRVPLVGRYRLRWVLAGYRTSDPTPDIWYEIDFARDMKKTEFVKQQKRSYIERIQLEAKSIPSALPARPNADDANVDDSEDTN